MVELEHKNHGSKGSEFVLHHCIVQPRRLISSLIVTTTATVVFGVYEMDAAVLLVISGMLLVALLFRLWNKVSRESLLVLPSIGVQVKTQYWLGHQTTQFFDRSCVKGIIINEAITMQSVICYLAVLLTSHKTGQVEQVYPLFTHSWPRLKDLIRVYQAIENMNTCGSIHQQYSDNVQQQKDFKQGAGDSPAVINANGRQTVKHISEIENKEAAAVSSSSPKRRSRTVKSNS